ncbi:MAG: oligosaccharide flippase family protein, partial [Clostridium sp.]
MKKNPLITGTLLLTAAGFLSRILGFFYRIFLSRAIGAEGLGIYQMIFPIHGIAFALCAGPIQTSISRLAAANTNKAKNTFRTGLIISLCFSFIIAIVIRQFASFISEHILLEPLCAPLLPVMALSIPFSAVHACICGYYYGLKKTVVPALSQLVEQMIRIGAVLLIARVSATNGHSISVTLAVWGMLIGEIASAAFSFLIYSFTAPEETNTVFFSPAAPLMAMALPLMGNRLILNCLQSMEAIFVPNKLLAFGLTGSEALSTYGVLTGMALPFIFFPSAITNSLAVILLPTVSEAEASGDHQKIERTIAMALRYSMYMGILCIGIFTLFG